jgi:hypothetical protein
MDPLMDPLMDLFWKSPSLAISNKCRSCFDNHLVIVTRVRGLSGDEAKRAAFENVLVEFQDDDFPRHSDPNACLWCRRPEEPGAPLIPLGLGRQTAWLHRDPCAEKWRQTRRADAIAKLAAMGIVRPIEGPQQGGGPA